MVEFLLELIKFNSEVPDYSIIIPLIFLYLFSLWLIVSIWVYYDARKRYAKKMMAISMAMLNFILQFPFLFVYLLVRPPDLEESEEWIEGGVNVPIINFTGNEGVVMSLELRINPKAVADAKTPEMKIDVSFDSEDEKKQLINIENKQTGTEEKTIIVHKTGFIQKFKSKFFSVRPKKKHEHKKDDKKEDKKVEDAAEKTTVPGGEVPTESTEANSSDPQDQHKKKHRKQRRRR